MKNTKNQNPDKGLGDTVEKIFKSVGVDKLAKWALGEDCGCSERKQYLNKLFPYNKPECLIEQEYNYLKDFFRIADVFSCISFFNAGTSNFKSTFLICL